MKLQWFNFSSFHKKVPKGATFVFWPKDESQKSDFVMSFANWQSQQNYKLTILRGDANGDERPKEKIDF